MKGLRTPIGYVSHFCCMMTFGRGAGSVLDNQNLVARLDHAYARLNNYREKAYWLWHDLLDILDFLAPYDQDCLDDTEPQEEKERIENALLQPNNFCKTC